jgi:basic membrane protein A
VGVFVKYVEAADDNAFEPMLRAFAQRDFDLIIGIGFAQKEAIKKVAAQFPKKHFAIIDAQVDEPNVRSLMFEEHEGAYIIGAIAALTSKTGKVGFVGGMDVPLIRRFAMGYGCAKAVNPKLPSSRTIAASPASVEQSAERKELALAQYDADVDISSPPPVHGLGVFDAAGHRSCHRC